MFEFIFIPILIVSVFSEVLSENAYAYIEVEDRFRDFLLSSSVSDVFARLETLSLFFIDNIVTKVINTIIVSTMSRYFLLEINLLNISILINDSIN